MGLPDHLAALLLGACVAVPAAAQVTCCDVDGKRICGDPPPPQCLARPKTVFDKGGVARTLEAPMTAEQRAAREAEAARKTEEEKMAAEQSRRDRALLDSYTTEQDIDKARERAIADIEKNAEQAQSRLDAALEKHKKLDQEKEFYLRKPLPPQLAVQIRDNEHEIVAQQKILAQRDVDVAAVKERYAADKARYRQIVGSK